MSETNIRALTQADEGQKRQIKGKS